jgi:GC-rich sequence DNA-binding factor-like protein
MYYCTVFDDVQFVCALGVHVHAAIYIIVHYDVMMCLYTVFNASRHKLQSMHVNTVSLCHQHVLTLSALLVRSTTTPLMIITHFHNNSITPALARALREDFTINPSAQDPALFMYILQWSHILPAIHTLSLLQGELFPKWRTALHHWLCSGTADLGEVIPTVVIECMQCFVCLLCNCVTYSSSHV